MTVPHNPEEGRPPSTDFLLGQMSAQLREMIHAQNNTSQAMNGLESSLGKRIDDTNNQIRAMGVRVAALEADKARKEGATGVLVALLKSPTLGWLVGAAISAWAILTGRVHLP